MTFYKSFYPLFALILFISCKEKFLWVADFDKTANTNNTWFVAGNKSLVVHHENKYPLTIANISVEKGTCYTAGFFQKNIDPLQKIAISSDSDFYIERYWLAQSTPKFHEVKMQFCIPEKTAFNKINAFVFNHSSQENLIDSLYFQKVETSNSPLPKYLFWQLSYNLVHYYSIQKQEILDSSTFFSFISAVEDDFFETHGISKQKFEKTSKEYFSKHLFNEWKNNIKEQKNLMAHPSVAFKYEEKMNDSVFAAYANKIIYQKNDAIQLNFLNQKSEITLNIYKLLSNYKSEWLSSQKISDAYYEIATSSLEKGFYKLMFVHEKDSFAVPIIINDDKVKKVAILAPVTTWHAYNTFGGKSFYKNGIDSFAVHFISTQRPINSVYFDSVFLGHDMFILKNIFDWFDEKYGANIYPDYYLEAFPKLFEKHQTIVLAQHCEYFSPSMYKNLKQLTSDKNLLALGGNQVYWKVFWHENFTKLEVRKDGTFFENTHFPGGLWRNNYFSEATLLGGAYTDVGYATYSPYKIIENKHWVFDGLNVKKGEFFGAKGIDGRGLSGDEMDKSMAGTPPDAQILAKGENPNNGGGEIILIERNKVATLSCGSIACGSGLGVDTVFSKMIENFMDKYSSEKMQ